MHRLSRAASTAWRSCSGPSNLPRLSASTLFLDVFGSTTLAQHPNPGASIAVDGSPADKREAADLNVTRALPPMVWSARGSGYRTNYMT